MTTLEKILQDAYKLKVLYSEYSLALLDKGDLPCEYDKSDIESAKVKVISEVMEIIKKHLSCENHTETTRQPQDNGWIPCSERMPEESLNSVIGWDEYRERCCFVQYYNGRWVLGNDTEPVKIIAWRPLPEPYKPPTESAEEKSMRERKEFFSGNDFLTKRFMEVR